MKPITIDRGVPIPPRTKHPLPSLLVGESFQVPKALAKRTFKACHRYASLHDMDIVTRTQPDGSLRVWRVA